MNPNIVKYFLDNKQKYTKESLIGSLRSAGYNEGDIQSAVEYSYRSSADPVSIQPANTKPKETISQEERNKRMSYGFGGVVGFWLVLSLFNLGFLVYLVGFFVALYFRNKKRDIFYGMLIGITVIIIMQILGVSYLLRRVF